MGGGISDIRSEIFRGRMDARVKGVLSSEREGVLSGLGRARKMMEDLGLLFETRFSEGSTVKEGERIASVLGNPLQIAMAEEQIIGALSKSSGIATAARLALSRIGTGRQVVSGGWKKMPFELKPLVRQAALDGGVQVRISQNPFIYLDKNYVRILGGVRESIQKVIPLGASVVIQVRGETGDIREEAVAAAESGATVIMVDTGSRRDLQKVTGALRERGLRSRVQVAFSGSIALDEIQELAALDLDIVDIGYAIMDGPCLPMRFDVVAVE